jgi:hypothetical protein
MYGFGAQAGGFIWSLSGVHRPDNSLSISMLSNIHAGTCGAGNLARSRLSTGLSGEQHRQKAA